MIFLQLPVFMISIMHLLAENSFTKQTRQKIIINNILNQNEYKKLYVWDYTLQSEYFNPLPFLERYKGNENLKATIPNIDYER